MLCWTTRSGVSCHRLHHHHAQSAVNDTSIPTWYRPWDGVTTDNLWTPVVVTNYIDVQGDWFDDGITCLRGESAQRGSGHSGPLVFIELIARGHSEQGQRRAVDVTARHACNKRGNDMNDRRIRSIAAIGTSAVVAVVAVATQHSPGSTDADAGFVMPIGATVTESTAPTAPPITRATPGITGPAPLPPEEQGLPG
jgi:hypothetical protein